MKSIFSTALLLMTAVPVAAQNPPVPPQASAPPARPNPLDKVTCRTEEVVGTRLGGHRVCATLREWQEQQQENRDAVEKIQQQGQANPHG